MWLNVLELVDALDGVVEPAVEDILEPRVDDGWTSGDVLDVEGILVLWTEDIDPTSVELSKVWSVVINPALEDDPPTEDIDELDEVDGCETDAELVRDSGVVLDDVSVSGCVSVVVSVSVPLVWSVELNVSLCVTPVSGTIDPADDSVACVVVIISLAVVVMTVSVDGVADIIVCVSDGTGAVVVVWWNSWVESVISLDSDKFWTDAVYGVIVVVCISVTAYPSSVVVVIAVLKTDIHELIQINTLRVEMVIKPVNNQHIDHPNTYTR